MYWLSFYECEKYHNIKNSISILKILNTAESCIIKSDPKCLEFIKLINRLSSTQEINSATSKCSWFLSIKTVAEKKIIKKMIKLIKKKLVVILSRILNVNL